jgi:DivIVA domain-containing protein
LTDWAARIRGITFSPVRMGEAYDMDQVDYLLDLLEVAATQGDPLGPVLEGVEVNQVRLREGYSIPEVDAFFAEIRASGGEPATPAPSDRDQVQAPTPVLETEPTLLPPGPPEPVRGFWRRLFGRN